MPTVRIPFVEVNSQRNPDAYNNTSKDARAINCVYKTAPNPITREVEVWCEKRLGAAENATIDGTNTGNAIYTSSHGGGETQYSTFSSSTSGRVFKTTTLIGTTDALTAGKSNVGLTQITEGIVGGVRHLFFSHPNLTTTAAAYYLDTSVNTATTTFTADTTSGNPVLSNVSSTANLRVGQKLSGTGIAATARIASGGISGTNVTMTDNATANGATVTITQEHISKFMSSNLPSRLTGPIQFLNGRAFLLDLVNNRVYQTALNDLQTVASDGYITLDALPDQALSLARAGDILIGFGQASAESFRYSFNASGSQLSRVSQINNGVPFQSISGSCSIENSIYYAGYYGGVFRISDPGPERITPPMIDAVMSTSQAAAFSGAGAYLDAFYYNGRPMLSLTGITWTDFTAPTFRYCFWYDIGLNSWTEQVFSISSSNRAMRFSNASQVIYAVAVAPLGKNYIMNFTSPTYQDGGANLTMTLQTNKRDEGTKKLKTYSSAMLIGDTQSSGTATLEYSDDDYATWVTAGTFDLTNLNQALYALGSSRSRAWRLTDSRNGAARYQGLEVEFTVGTN